VQVCKQLQQSSLSGRVSSAKMHLNKRREVCKTWHWTTLKYCLTQSKFDAQLITLTCHLGITICQSIVRKYLKATHLALQEHERRVLSATIIQAGWRGYLYHKIYTDTVLRVGLIQSNIWRLIAERFLGRIIRGDSTYVFCWLIHAIGIVFLHFFYSKTLAP
jgi:hypothetical protein